MQSTIELSSADIYGLFRPTQRCDLRVFMRQQGIAEAPPGPFADILIQMGKMHEEKHLDKFTSVFIVSQYPREEREKHTIEAILDKTPVIYQPTFRAKATLENENCEIIGIPDFILYEGGEHIIRDSKIARRITEKDHLEIILQLGLYGWLFEQTTGFAPSALEVHCGTDELIEVPYDGGEAALSVLSQILRIKKSDTPPFSPVGWSKCNGCGFFDNCWQAAEKRFDPAMVEGVDQGLAIALHEGGFDSIKSMLDNYDKDSLADLQRPWGKRMQRVGKKAERILLAAKAIVTKKEILISKPDIPANDNYVMFDLEGLPPQFDELEKIYLWGTQVFGENPGEFQAALSGFGPDGDKTGWFNFLSNAKKIFDDYGDIKFVHWASYEKTKLRMYMKRYGDQDDVAARVIDSLLDLLIVTRNSLILPVSSYSLKVIEKYVGFTRTQDEYGGDWAIAKYIEAVESEDEDLRTQYMDEIIKYNREDLEATWAVFKWLRGKGD